MPKSILHDAGHKFVICIPLQRDNIIIKKIAMRLPISYKLLCNKITQTMDRLSRY